MPVIEIPDKQMVVDFPNTMTAQEIETAIQGEIYGQREKSAPIVSVPNTPVPLDYGLRADGTPKGTGWLGELKRPDGKVSTELSIGVEFDGKEREIPALVPTLIKPEIDHLLSGAKPTDAIVNKAVAFARQRISQGKSPFKEQPKIAASDRFNPAISTIARRAERGAQEQADQLGAPISTITGKPIPTTDEKFEQTAFMRDAPASAIGILGGIGAQALGGYTALLRLVSTGDLDKAKTVLDEISAQPAKFIKTPQQAKVVENISKAMMYLPEKGGEALAWMGKIADTELQKMGSAPTYLEPTGKTIGEAAVILAFPALKAKIAKSNWFRMLANEERGLVVQSLDNAIKMNPKMTEGEILRKWDNPQWREEALSKRATGETPQSGASAGTPAPKPSPTDGLPPEEIIRRTEILESQAAKGIKLTPKQEVNLNAYKSLIAERIKPTISKEDITPTMAGPLLGREPIQSVLPKTIDTSSVETTQTVPGQEPISQTPKKLMNIPVNIVESKTENGVSHELYKAASEKDNRSFYRIFDTESGKAVGVKGYPTLEAAKRAYESVDASATLTAVKVGEEPSSEAPTIEQTEKAGTDKAAETEVPDLDALDLMAVDILNTKGNERGDYGEGTVHQIGSSNPEWFKKLNKSIDFEHFNGEKTVKYDGISRDTFFAIQKKIKAKGVDSLTEIQKRYYFFIQQVIPDFKAQSSDFKAMDDLAFMEEKGYEPLGGKKIIAGDLKDGDKVIIRGEEFENKGMNADGTMTLEDGIPIKVDVFDEITIERIKKAPIPEMPEELRKKIEEAAIKAGGRLDYTKDGKPGYAHDRGTFSVTDLSMPGNETSFDVRTPEEIAGKFAEARKAAEKAKTETLPEGLTVNWNKVETKVKDGVKGTYYATYNKDGSFKKWHTKTEIDRLKTLKGTEGLNLKQDSYGKQTGVTGKETKGKQAGFGFVVEDPSQPEMFSQEPPPASKVKAAEKKPESPEEFNIGNFSDKPVTMQMPELVQLFKELSQGKYPQITKIIGRSLRTQGAFNPVTGGVRLQKDIFADQTWALKVLAHEIGHWIDWMPDKNLSRGNILGRVASLKGYMDHWLDDIYGGKGRITDADKKFFKREAKKLAGGERWIDEVIEKTLPITPDDILDIWNSGLPKEALHAGLLDYIMRLDTAEKKAIVVAAMKGIIPDDVKQFARIAKEYTGKKIKVKIPASDQAIMDKYKELIAEELKKRNIYNLDEIRNELKAFTQEWKPFEPDGDPTYTKYRFSGKELYADAMSGLLTNPDAFRVVAPRFYSAWFSWIHRKPEFKSVWEAWQNKISAGSEEVTKERMQNIYDMFEKNDKARIDELMKQREGSIVSAYDGLMTYFWDKNHKALGLLRTLKKEKGVNADHATETRNMIEEANYIASEISVYVGDIFEHIMNPIEAMGYDAKELGLVLFQKRVLGDRSEIGNPLGHSPETTTVDIKNIEDNIWGKEKTKAINDFADKLRSIRESLVLPLVQESGLATPEFMGKIKDTKSYATFSNIEWFKNKGGSGPGAGFYRQIGTLSEIENPLVSLILKDISLVRAARINITKRELSIDLYHAGAIEQAKMRWSKDANGNVPVEPTDPKKSPYSFMVQGKAEHYYVSKKIADMFAYAPVEAQQLATIWRYLSQPIREIFVSKNPIWMTRNVIRDVRQTIKNIPEVTLKDIPKLLLEYKRAFNEVRRYVFGKEMSPAIRQLFLDKAIPVNRIWAGFDETTESELDRIGISLDLSRKQNLDSAIAIRAIKSFWDALDKVGMISDIWGKVAGGKYLKKYSDRTPKQIAGVVRRRVGTPDYKRTGTGQQITNSVALFSNIGKEGVRAAIESATEDPGGYAWKTLWMNVMPKLIINALGSGAILWGMNKLGYDDKDDEDIKKVKTLQRVIEGISEYDRANYTIIPLGLTDSGKSAFLRIPEDYEGQFWGALVHKLMTGRILGHEGVFNLIGDQSPYSWHPYINAISRLSAYYVKGQNPVDDYRGRSIMSDATYTAGGAAAHKVMAKSTWKELGGSLIYEPAWDGLEKSEKSYEKALHTFPLSALGTFLRFSDQGITEKIEKEISRIRQTKAKQTLEKNEAFIRLVNGEELTPEQTLEILIQKKDVRQDKIMSLLGRKYGGAYLRQLTRADLSKEEKIAVFMMMIMGQAETPTEKPATPPESKVPGEMNILGLSLPGTPDKKRAMRQDKINDWSDRYLSASNKKDARSLDKIRMELMEFNRAQKEKKAFGITINMSDVIQSAQRKKSVSGLQ